MKPKTVGFFVMWTTAPVGILRPTRLGRSSGTSRILFCDDPVALCSIRYGRRRECKWGEFYQIRRVVKAVSQ